jgi:voltage-gated potassium channel
MEFLIFRISGIALCFAASSVEKIQKLTVRMKQADLKTYKLIPAHTIIGLKNHGLSAYRYVLRPLQSGRKDVQGILVDDIEMVEDRLLVSASSSSNSNGLFTGILENRGVHCVDIAKFISQGPDRAQRSEILTGFIQKKSISPSKRITNTARLEQKRIRRNRTKRQFRNGFSRVISSISFKIAVFLIILIGLSMLGIYVFEPPANSEFTNLWDTFWFSIVTITTVGYGDMTPVTWQGRMVGLILMGMGVVVVAAITGQIASFFVDQQLKRREGLGKVKKMTEHFLILGWRKELERVIDDILEINPMFDAGNIVLVNTVDREKLQRLFNNPKYHGITYIHGDYIHEETLLRAGIKKASRVMILADFSQDYSTQEVDSRTVMTVLTIESLNKQIYVCAELLDAKFEKYLKLANCDEVILSREYSKLILANASTASGISNIIADLLSTSENKGLRTHAIPEEFIGKTFGQLFDYYSGRYGEIVIGILENTGNFYHRKKEALNEAQKTPDISRLIENLREVKDLIPNKSVLNPGRSYMIQKNSRAIVLEQNTEVSA